ncbi:hypothetical protein C8J56DRAFT_911172 [Mycena floridula]|nr:hypothetical protein C8J56DRAFT_911172 [Mycena floridula]
MATRIPASAFTVRRIHNNVPPVSSRPPASSVSIPRLREAINSLDSKMASLMSQRRELESNLEQAVRSQSPVLRLPSELLSSIFVIGVLEFGDENPVMVATLMLVCRYWADVTLGTPVLWSKISVSQHDSLEKARRKLTRSKSCPLDVTINFPPRTEFVDSVSSVTEQVIHAMDLIRPALWRTKSFCLNVPNRPQAHAALLRCQEEAPILETLCIQVFHSMQEDHYSSPPLPLFNGCTPKLRSCSLTSFNFGWDLRLVTRLRVLKLGGYFNEFTPSATTLLNILRECPLIETLALRNMSDVDSESCYPSPVDDFSPPPTTKKIQLSKLKTVSFYYAGNALARQILGQIVFPNLETLELYYMENITPILQLLYTQALIRLPMKVLRIESCFFNELKFLNLLRRLPSLSTLELVDVEDASSNLLKGLSSAQPWVCPRLENLSLDGCTSFDWDSLRSLIESRIPANSHAFPTSYDPKSFHALPKATSSASAAAAAGAMRPRTRPGARVVPGSLGPQRLRCVDVTRVNQISKEMVQWMKMYVADVKCEPAKKNVWG